MTTSASVRREMLRPTGTLWSSSSRRGARSVNADAVAAVTDPETGRIACVVADGVGDHLTAARAARACAAVAARVGARTGARAGILAAQQELLREFPQPEADSVLVVAVLPAPGRPDAPCDIAWVGDCRAYRWNGRVLHQTTTDHTVAELWRARARSPEPRMEHMVTTSIRTARPFDIGYAATGSSTGRLLLCTDGVHRCLGIATIKAILADDRSTGFAADSLVDTALRRGGSDNATALIVDGGPLLTGLDSGSLERHG
ncbi:PP2C family protein-serine/threonine phosphatase [Nocardia paucivorans]|uniref:PP2C family protein-serine/threonine phosphatase n=1 Tax=Nocardia paucivorans TaxID=114259 RepID=UPI001FE1D4A6|nr:serine/threonine protein phosphatase [Nocardia paucivorans]